MITKIVAGILAILVVVFGGYTLYNHYNQPFEDTFPEAQSDPWANDSYTHRKMINVTHVNASGSNLVNYTVFLNVTKETEMQSDFDDVLFYESDGTIMSFEHENHTTDYGLFWVLVPTLTAASDTQFYMYYGNGAASSPSNPEATWNVNYSMVQHLQEAAVNDSAGDHVDSTSNNNDGTAKNFDGTATSTTDGTGKIDGADVFDGTNDYVDCGNDASLNITDSITIEAWVKVSEIDNYDTFVAKTDGSNFRWAYQFDNSINGHTRIYLNGITPNTLEDDTTPLNTGNWYFLTTAYDSLYIRLYLNGTELKNITATGTISLGSESVLIGAALQLNNYFDGTIDEVRISNVARTADWINQSYQLVANQSTFVGWGVAEENQKWYLTGLDYNGTHTLEQINASINSTNLNQIVYTNETGYSWVYTYGNTANSAIEVKQGQAFWCNVTGTIEKARVW